MTKKPLVEKKLKTLPKNSEEWIKYWNKTNDPLALLSLLRHGPEGYSEEVDVLYLRLARRFWESEQVFSEKCPYGEKKNIFNCPKTILAKAAFKALCKYAFRETENNKSPWEGFVYNETLLEELIIFLGVDDINSENDELHSLIVYSHDDEGILESFCLGLAEHIISESFKHDHFDKQRKIELLKLWRSHRKSALRILWYFDKLEDVLFRYREKINEGILDPLRGMILSHEIVADTTLSSEETRRKPVDVKDVLRIKPGNHYWYQNPQLLRAAYLYIGLTS